MHRQGVYETMEHSGVGSAANTESCGRGYTKQGGTQGDAPAFAHKAGAKATRSKGAHRGQGSLQFREQMQRLHETRGHRAVRACDNNREREQRLIRNRAGHIRGDDPRQDRERRKRLHE